MDSRKLARETLTGLLDNISTFVEVYDHLALTFGGVTPIGMVESFGTGWINDNFQGHQRVHRLNIYIWWEWKDANEDRVDDLSAEVVTVLEANQRITGVWDNLEIDLSASSLTYSEPDENGIVYRIELIPVLVW